MANIPFLRPNLVKKETYLPYLEQMEQTRIYTNYGPLNDCFERKVMEQMFGCEGAATTVSNATVGLMLAIAHMKRPHARYALMPSFTFAATPLAAMWCGLEPYFIDISPDDWCMNEAMLEQELERLGEEAAVVVPYATFGTALDLTRYRKLQHSGVPVVIDAAASFGTLADGTHFGQGFPGAVVFSFHATKSFGIGEGGLIYSADKELVSRLRQAGNFGFSGRRESVLLGLNSKISEPAAALALSTMEAFPRKIAARRRVQDAYLRQLADSGLLERGWGLQQTSGRMVPQFFSMVSPLLQTGDQVTRQLALQGIESRTYFAPACHRQPLFAACPRTSMEVTEDISDRIVSLPLWEEMSDREVSQVVKGLAEI